MVEVFGGPVDQDAGASDPGWIPSLSASAAFAAEARATGDRQPAAAAHPPAARPADPPAEPAVKRLPIELFAARAEKIFERVDSSANGFLSDTELVAAMQDRSYKGEDAQVVAALFHARSLLAAISDDELLPDWSGITRSDLREFDRVQRKFEKEYQPVADVVTFLGVDNAKNFARIDRDDDGFLSALELRTAAQEPHLSSDSSRNIEFLRTNQQTIQDKYNDRADDHKDDATRKGISKSDVYYQYVEQSRKTPKATNQIMGAIEYTAESQAPSVSMELYGDLQQPIKSITAEAVKQGRIGNCYLGAAIASVAHSDPASILRMIKDNKDGTYTVTFPGDRAEPVTVQAPTASEMAFYNRGSSQGTWACVLEKAYGSYLQESVFRRSPNNLLGGTMPQEGSDGGGYTDSALRLLTGRNSKRDWLAIESKEGLAKQLRGAFAANPPRPVTAGIVGRGNSHDGWAQGHAYSITGFKPDGKGQGIVTVRNPWGAGSGNTVGEKEISLDELFENFSCVTISQPAK